MTGRSDLQDRQSRKLLLPLVVAAPDDENDFIGKLNFGNGVLKSENTEGRGKGKSDCLGK